MNRLFLAALLAGGLLLSACGSGEPERDAASEVGAPPEQNATEPAADEAPLGGGGSAAGSCALLVEYDGRTYFGATVANAPATAESLGQGTFPPCNDTPDIESADAGEPVEVLALEGVDPQDAVGVEGRTEIFVREGVDPATVLEG